MDKACIFTVCFMLMWLWLSVYMTPKSLSLILLLFAVWLISYVSFYSIVHGFPDSTIVLPAFHNIAELA